jgi:hypothetical protein
MFLEKAITTAATKSKYVFGKNSSIKKTINYTSDSQPGVRVPLGVPEQVTRGTPKFKISSK